MHGPGTHYFKAIDCPCAHTTSTPPQKSSCHCCLCLCSEHQKAQQQRQRQAAAEARLAEQAAESAARQRKAARSDAVSAYKTLLAEVVRDAEASFQSWLPKLKKDPLVSGLRGP